MIHNTQSIFNYVLLLRFDRKQQNSVKQLSFKKQKFKKNTGVVCPSLLQGNLPDLGIQPRSPAFQADSLQSEPSGKPFKCTYQY